MMNFARTQTRVRYIRLNQHLPAAILRSEEVVRQLSPSRMEGCTAVKRLVPASLAGRRGVIRVSQLGDSRRIQNLLRSLFCSVLRALYIWKIRKKESVRPKNRRILKYVLEKESRSRPKIQSFFIYSSERTNLLSSRLAIMITQ